MLKKDRIAIVLSCMYINIPIVMIMIAFIESSMWPESKIIMAGILVFLLMGYWGIRFIKNDISFLKTYNNNGE